MQPLASQIYGLYTGSGLSDADLRRAVGRPPARPAPHHHHRRHADGDRTFHDGVRAAVPVRVVCADPRQRRLQAEYLHPSRRSLSRRTTTAATAPIRSSMSASISARSWRRWSAARSAKKPAGIMASPPPASACRSGLRSISMRMPLLPPDALHEARPRIERQPLDARRMARHRGDPRPVHSDRAVLGHLRTAGNTIALWAEPTPTARSICWPDRAKSRRPGFRPSTRS